MKAPALFTWALLAGLAPAFAQSTSTSASYALLHAPAGDLGGGGRVTNASTTVSADISVGDPASGGVSAVSAGGVQTKGNLVGQLYEITALQLAASPLAINEAGTLQLGASQLLDDGTTISLAANTVTWSVQSGPLSSVNSSGLATAGTVGQNTGAVAQGSSGGLSAILNLTVLDTIKVKAKATLTAATWNAITASTPSDNGPERTVTDLSATGAAKFYHVEITKP